MTFRIAFKALGRNKMRTGLTMLGMIIGVAAVITLVAMGNGAQSMIEDQIKGAGTNMITLTPATSHGRRVRAGASSSPTRTTLAIKRVRGPMPRRRRRGRLRPNWFMRNPGRTLPSAPEPASAFFRRQDVSATAPCARGPPSASSC